MGGPAMWHIFSYTVNDERCCKRRDGSKEKQTGRFRRQIVEYCSGRTEPLEDVSRTWGLFGRHNGYESVLMDLSDAVFSHGYHIDCLQRSNVCKHLSVDER